MAPAQSTLRRRLRDGYALPLAAHYLSRRRLYSNLLMVAFSAYVLQNVSNRPRTPRDAHRPASGAPAADRNSSRCQFWSAECGY